MKLPYPLAILIVIVAALPSVAASQPQVPTPTGYLGGRVSADETGTVAVAPTKSATPPASPTADDVPGADECAVAPRDRDIAELNGAPASSIVGPEESRRGTPRRTLTDLPSGQAADDATVRAVTATVRRLVACANSQDGEAYEALHTDDYFRRVATVTTERQESESVLDWLFGVSETTSVGYGFVMFPPNTPMPDVTDVTILPDRRVGAIVRGPTFSPIFFAFAREQPDGTYLVDEAIQIIEPSGTPSA